MGVENDEPYLLLFDSTGEVCNPENAIRLET
jgi:hypothetical protein